MSELHSDTKISFTLQNITNNTSFIGKNLIVLKKIDSTNDYAKLLLANSGPVQDGTVILAEEQYGGRGQAGSSWQSDPRKNLTFSIVLGCSFLPPCRQFYLSMAMSLGVLDCVQSLIEKAGIARNACGKQACVKWPNDIYVGRKKLGGILIENILSGSVMKTSVVGIGLNVNQENFPGLPGATSLKLETKGDFPLEALLDSLCQAIEARFLQLKSGAREDLKEVYLRHLLGFGRKQLFRAGPAGAGRRPSAFTSDAAGTALPTVPFEGFISGITPEGKLLVSTAEGVQSFDRKEIVFL